MHQSRHCTGIIVLAQNRRAEFPGCAFEERIPSGQLDVVAVHDDKGPGLRIVCLDDRYRGKTLRPQSQRILSEKHFWTVYNQLKDWE